MSAQNLHFSRLPDAFTTLAAILVHKRSAWDTELEKRSSHGTNPPSKIVRPWGSHHWPTCNSFIGKASELPSALTPLAASSQA
jgi:hypothetical protein